MSNGNVYQDTVEYQEAVRAYSTDPSRENAERLKLAEAEHERKTFERMKAAQDELAGRVKQLKEDQVSLASRAPAETKLERTKKLITKVSAALTDCRLHNQELHRMLAANVKNKVELRTMLMQLRNRKKDLIEKSNEAVNKPLNI